MQHIKEKYNLNKIKDALINQNHVKLSLMGIANIILAESKEEIFEIIKKYENKD